ncbi:MAG TPA: hypothetical protein PK771_05375, partial [Spirochaetota bacterium]|nr:hypothetical protein [Spirochaetota bacterium]
SVKIERFKKGFLSRRVILKELAPFILREPIFHGCYDNDIKNEFFATVASKIERIISDYKEIETANFITWFSVVLRNEFLMFIRVWNKIENFETKEVYILNNIHNGFEEESYEEYNFEESEKSPKIDLSILSDTEKLILQWKFGITNQNVNLEEIQSAIESKISLKKRYEELINKKFIDLIRIQQKINKEIDKHKKKALTDKEKRIKKIKRRYEHLYNNILCFPSNKDVANKLNYSSGTIGAYISRIKTKFEKVGYENMMQ